jgi:hypothetical protein
VRPAQPTGYRPAQVLQLDWGEMPTRPKLAGRQRRIYALVATLPYSGAQTAHFSFDLTAESFLEGHVRIRHAAETVASYPRSYDRGQWFPPPQLRPEPPASPPVARLIVPQVAPPELADYAELCA